MIDLHIPTFRLGSFFKREKFDPTQFSSINETWDENTYNGGNTTTSVTTTRQYQNLNLPLEEQIKLKTQELEQFDKALPSLIK